MSRVTNEEIQSQPYSANRTSAGFQAAPMTNQNGRGEVACNESNECNEATNGEPRRRAVPDSDRPASRIRQEPLSPTGSRHRMDAGTGRAGRSVRRAANRARGEPRGQSGPAPFGAGKSKGDG